MAANSFDYHSLQNGTNWYNKAKSLKKASDKIREAYLIAYRNLDRGKRVTQVPNGIKIDIDLTTLEIDDLDHQYSIAMLLMGYAMENIFRGIIIVGTWLEDPNSVNTNNFSELQVPIRGSTEKRHLMGHHLKDLLAAKAMTIQFDDSEKKMMDTLDMFIVWGGRYATPLEYDSTDPMGLRCLEPIEYPYQALDSLYVKSMEKLVELCRLQGEKLSGA